MAKMVFALKYVPEEEADTIRALLSEHEIAFYETTAGRWQISLAAIWVRNNEDYDRARELIEDDQRQRQTSLSLGKVNFFEGMLAHGKQNPVEFFFSLIALGFVIGVSVIPFIV